MIGKKATNYWGEKGTIIDAAPWPEAITKLRRYDNSGWMSENSEYDLELDPTDIIVAFKPDDEDQSVDVYVYGPGGVELI